MIYEIHITTACNQNCTFCNVKKKSKYISDTDFANRLTVLSNEDILYISGGEPLLHPKIISLVRCASKKARVVLETNGTLLSKSMLHKLIKAGLEEIHISIHGFEKSHNAITGGANFKKLLAALNVLSKTAKKVRVSTNTVITKTNIHEIIELVPFIYNKYPFLKQIRVSYPRFYPSTLNQDIIPLTAINYTLTKLVFLCKQEQIPLQLENIPACIVMHKDIQWNTHMIQPTKIQNSIDNIRKYNRRCLSCPLKIACVGFHPYYDIYFNSEKVLDIYGKFK